MDETNQHVNLILKKSDIDAVIFVPHSVNRKIQFMDLYQVIVSPKVPRVPVKKIFKNEVIPQKSISNLTDRIANANATNIVPVSKAEAKEWKKVLVIDDAIGSGSTINVLARKLQDLNPKIIVLGYAVVGSYKGFEVIGEVYLTANLSDNRTLKRLPQGLTAVSLNPIKI